MKKSTFSEETIAVALHQAETGVSQDRHLIGDALCVKEEVRRRWHQRVKAIASARRWESQAQSARGKSQS